MNKDNNINNQTKVFIKHDPQEDDMIFIESQTGPQEQPCLMEHKLDLHKFRKYQNKRRQKND